MKLSLILLVSISMFSLNSAILRPTAARSLHRQTAAQPILIRAHPPRPSTIGERQRLITERNIAEMKAHQARQEAAFWKQQAQRCQKYGCTKVCLAHIKNNCQDAQQEQQKKALQAFYKYQALNNQVPRMPLRPKAQK